MKLSPAEYVAYIFGSARQASLMLERDESAVSRWNMKSWRGGRDGRVPDTDMVRLLTIAKKRGLDLTAEDLIFGRVLKPPEPAS